jgi:glycosyltransferase involved in cell wall biosynthesis
MGPGQPGRSLLALAAAASRDRLDLFFSPGYFLPLWPGRKVVTFHDANMIQQADKWWRPGMKLTWLSLVTQSLLSAKLAQTIVADSFAAATSISSAFRLPANKIHVVYPGVDDRFFRAPDRRHSTQVEGVRARYILSVGVLSPQKNLEGIIRAFAALPQSDLELRIVGRDDGPYFDATLAPLLRRLGVERRVRKLGVVPPDQLAALYTGAEALVYPSFAEGFGLPPLEAMACGTPVVASNLSSLPEVLGDAALLVDPHDIGQVADATARILADSELRRTLIARGRRRAQRYRWAETARHMLAIFEADD